MNGPSGSVAGGGGGGGGGGGVGGNRGGMTLVHVTHEAVEHIGGIGTVLEGLVTSPVYQREVGRTVMVGPLPWPERVVRNPVERLGPHGARCLYSGADGYDPEGLGAVLRPIEWAFGVRVVYGTRTFEAAGGLRGESELVLIDVRQPNPERLAAFKWMLFERFGIDSRAYEHGWDYEEWCRLADPAYHALVALGVGGRSGGVAGVPAVVIGHEFMGVATALRCIMDRSRFRAVFHAHECSTARRIVEHLPGHDVAFYPAMRRAMARGQSVEEVFGSQADYSRHALVNGTHQLDGILAVGPETAEELAFLSPTMKRARISVAYNGLPAPRVTMAEKRRSRDLVNQWLRGVTGSVPDYLITHVTRPVPSKGLWRDQKVCAHLERHLSRAGKTGVYVLLTCGAPVRTFEQVCAMARSHGWPARHVEGYPDLDGPETGIWRAMDHFNQHVHHEGGVDARGKPDACPATIRAVLVNQFGFSRDRLGEAAPEGISIHDLRRAADVELGMSTYEPYGIAHLEALHAGAICLPSTVCGCLGLVKRAMADLGMGLGDCPLVLPVDFTDGDVADPVRFTAHERDAREEKVCEAAAAELFARLPTSDADRERLLMMGQRLAEKMSWDAVCERDILPALRRAVEERR